MRFVKATMAATVLVGGLSLASGARAEALKLNQVAADSKWVGHVDVDAMRGSTLVRKAWDKAMELRPAAKDHLAKIHELLGVDLAADLHAITVYGKVVGKEDGVMIVQAKLDRAKLEAMAAKAPEHKVVEAGPYKIHSWLHDDHGHKKPVAGAIQADDRLVLAGSVDEVKAALAVIDGKSSAMADDGPLRGRAVPGATAVFRVVGIYEAKLPGDPAMAKQMESYRFTMGEIDGKVFYRARATMTNEEVVGQLKTVLDGFLALGQIHVKGDAQGKSLLDATKVATEGKNVTVTFSAPVDAVWDQVVKHAKIAIEHRREARKAK
jgi:hypothetical protein